MCTRKGARNVRFSDLCTAKRRQLYCISKICTLKMRPPCRLNLAHLIPTKRALFRQIQNKPILSYAFSRICTTCITCLKCAPLRHAIFTTFLLFAHLRGVKNEEFLKHATHVYFRMSKIAFCLKCARIANSRQQKPCRKPLNTCSVC